MEILKNLPHPANYPLPPDLATLPTIEAKVKYRLGDGKKTPSLEGPVFDKYGNFYACLTAPDATVVKKITPDGEITDFFKPGKGMTIGLAVHKDGRFFATDMMRGVIRIINPEGELLDEIEYKNAGRNLRVDCMAFDNNGDLLFTDLSGTSFDPIGAIYKATQASGYREISVYFSGLAAPNGLCYSHDESVLWVAQTGKNVLTRLILDTDGTPRASHYTQMEVYKNTGFPVLDSTRVDKNGYVYQAVMFGGRVIIFSPQGIPVANVLVPGREEGRLPYSSNLVIKSDTNEAYLVASDDKDAVILSFETFAPSALLYSNK